MSRGPRGFSDGFQFASSLKYFDGCYTKYFNTFICNLLAPTCRLFRMNTDSNFKSWGDNSKEMLVYVYEMGYHETIQIKFKLQCYTYFLDEFLNSYTYTYTYNR